MCKTFHPTKMAKFCWDDEFVFYLIAKVRNNEFVWNYKHIMYKNKFKKQQFWMESVKDMNSHFNPIIPFSYGEVIKKWNNLKSYYTVENQKLFKAQKSGASIDSVETIESSWKFKSRLNFLSQIAEPTPSVNNFNKMSLKILSSSESREQLMNPETSTQIDSPLTSHLISDSIEDQLFFEEEEERPSSSPMTEKNTFKCSQASDHTFSSPPTPILKTTSDFGQSSQVPKHVKKKPRLAEKNGSIATTLIEASKSLTNAIVQQGERSRDQKTNVPEALPFVVSPFGMCISSEIDKLDDDLQIQAKQKMFLILMELQGEQLKRKKT